MRLAHARFHALLTHTELHRQRVDEESEPSVRAFAALHPTQEHGPKNHLLTTRQTRKHLGPGLMIQARSAYTQSPCPFTKPLAQISIHFKTGFRDASTVTLHIQQAEGRRWLVHSTKHPAEESLVLLTTHPETRLCHQVSERRWRGKLCCLTQQMCLDLFLHHVQHCVVANQMVQQNEQQPASLCPVPCQVQTQHRRLAYVDPMMTRIEPLAQLLESAFGWIQGHFLHGQDRFAPHHLHWLREILPGHCGAQDVVPIHHCLHRLRESIKSFAGVECELANQEIRIS